MLWISDMFMLDMPAILFCLDICLWSALELAFSFLGLSGWSSTETRLDVGAGFEALGRGDGTLVCGDEALGLGDFVGDEVLGLGDEAWGFNSLGLFEALGLGETLCPVLGLL